MRNLQLLLMIVSQLLIVKVEKQTVHPMVHQALQLFFQEQDGWKG